jgi:hypothetical protein
MAGLSILSHQYPEINFILKSRYEDFNESYNKPNTIFLANARRMHWVCFSNIYLSSNTKNIDKELYVVYDCFTKGSKSCSTHVDWLNGFSFFIEKLSPHLKKIAFYTVEIEFKVDADPALLALAYAVSIAEARHPAANEFEEKETMVQHFNDCVTTKKRFLDMFPIKRELITKNFRYTKHKFEISPKN